MGRLATLGRALSCVLLCIASVPLAGCRHRGPSAAELRGAEYSVRKVEFEGITRFKAKEIHDYLDLRPTDWAPLPEKHYFYEGLVPIDEQRIVDLYAACGYYQARVVDLRIDYLEDKSKVDLTYVIEEGEPTTVEQVVVRWPEGPPPGPPAEARTGPLGRPPELDPHALAELVPLEREAHFELATLQESSRALREALRNAGHPYATVEHRAEVDRVHHTARVEFQVRAGPFMRIGDIQIEGLATVPRRPVEVEMEFAHGRPYSPRLLQAIEQRVHGLGVFSTVAIVPPREPGTEGSESQGSGESEPATAANAEEGVLDLVLRVREGDPQRVQLGVELGLEPNRWDQQLVARYSHANTFRNLYQIALTARAGYAELPNPFRPIEHGPVSELALHAEKQGLLEKRLVWTLDPKLELDVQQGYQYWAANHRFGLSRFFTRWFGLQLSHTLRYVDFFRVSPTLDTADTILGLDFRDPYAISYVGLTPTLYIVDQIAAPNNGLLLGAEYRVAGGPFGGHFKYQQIVPFARLYWRPFERLQIAARTRIGMIFPFGQEPAPGQAGVAPQPGAPIDLRLYLGGADTVRGWGLRRLAPKIGDCLPDQDFRTGECESIPVGGNTSFLTNVEVRVRTWRKLWLAAFFDMGDVKPEVARFVPSQWNYSTGGGFRYDSPIGRFRLDVGVRLNETSLSEGEPVWALHFGLGESF